MSAVVEEILVAPFDGAQGGSMRAPLKMYLMQPVLHAGVTDFVGVGHEVHVDGAGDVGLPMTGSARDQD